MTSNARLLRETLEMALARDDFGQRFYARLFAAKPHLRPMFKSNSDGAQQKMFAQIASAVDGRDPEGVHDMRVATRRLRACLRVFARWLDTNGFAGTYNGIWEPWKPPVPR